MEVGQSWPALAHWVVRSECFLIGGALHMVVSLLCVVWGGFDGGMSEILKGC